MPTWVRAVILMPTTAITSTAKMTAVLMPMFGHVLVVAELKNRTISDRHCNQAA
jgi:hypothetical protein